MSFAAAIQSIFRGAAPTTWAAPIPIEAITSSTSMSRTGGAGRAIEGHQGCRHCAVVNRAVASGGAGISPRPKNAKHSLRDVVDGARVFGGLVDGGRAEDESALKPGISMFTSCKHLMKNRSGASVSDAGRPAASPLSFVRALGKPHDQLDALSMERIPSTNLKPLH
jgi:hypothetical protein